VALFSGSGAGCDAGCDAVVLQAVEAKRVVELSKKRKTILNLCFRVE
jgi:hypothetical protein